MPSQTNLLNKLAKQWQASLNSLPSNNYIGNRNNEYVAVNTSQNTNLLRLGLQFDDFKGRVPSDMPPIIADKNKDLKESSIDNLWKEIHNNNQQVMDQNKRKSFIELWPRNNSDIQIYYSIKNPIIHYSEVIGYIGKSINIRSTKPQKVLNIAQNQQLSWHNHTIEHNSQVLELKEQEARAIAFYLTGNTKILVESPNQAKMRLDNIKIVLNTTCSVKLIQTILSGTILKNTLEILQNENL